MVMVIVERWKLGDSGDTMTVEMTEDCMEQMT